MQRIEPVFYGFDRDECLWASYSSKEIQNENYVLHFLDYIAANDHIKWSIISSGVSGGDSNDITHEEIYNTLQSKSREYGLKFKDPTLSTIRNAAAVSNLCTGTADDKYKLKTFLESESKETGQYTLKIGSTVITLDTAKINTDNLKKLMEGNFKLFALLQALDQSKLTIECTDLLKNFGITAIVAQPDYQKINEKNVHFIDDMESNCELLSAAGFHAIVADTPAKLVERQHAVNKTEKTLNTAREANEDSKKILEKHTKKLAVLSTEEGKNTYIEEMKQNAKTDYEFAIASINTDEETAKSSEKTKSPHRKPYDPQKFNDRRETAKKELDSKLAAVSTENGKSQLIDDAIKNLTNQIAQTTLSIETIENGNTRHSIPIIEKQLKQQRDYLLTQKNSNNSNRYLSELTKTLHSKVATKFNGLDKYAAEINDDIKKFNALSNELCNIFTADKHWASYFSPTFTPQKPLTDLEKRIYNLPNMLLRNQQAIRSGEMSCNDAVSMVIEKLQSIIVCSKNNTGFSILLPSGIDKKIESKLVSFITALSKSVIGLSNEND